jgi:hypothetical protein
MGAEMHTDETITPKPATTTMKTRSPLFALRAPFATTSLALALAAGAAACGPSQEARAPEPQDPTPLLKATTHALEVEQTRPASEALDAWLKVLETARELRTTPLAREAAVAAIDAMTGRTPYGFARLGDFGVMHRVAGGPEKVIAALDATLASDGAKDPYIRAAAASTRMTLAAARGDAAGYAGAQKNAGCATEATVVGPFVGSVLTAFEAPGPIDGGAIEASYAAPSYAATPQLALGTAPTKTWGRGCGLDITGSARATGLRYLVFDVDVPRAETIHLGVASGLPTQLLIGGKPALTIPYAELGARTMRFADVEVTAPGKLRVVLKLGAFSTDTLVVHGYGDDGSALAFHAASVGAAPNGGVAAVGKMGPTPAAKLEGAANTVDGRVTRALGLLALGDVRLAEPVIAEVARPAGAGQPKPSPAAALVYARALDYARDIPSYRKLERLRAAYEATLEGWPTSWEAIAANAMIVSEQRRGGAGEIAGIQTAKARRDATPLPGTTEPSRKDATAYVDPLVDVFLALLGEDIYGVREESTARAKPKIKGTWLEWSLDRARAEETDDQTLKIECDPKRPDVSGTGCAGARARLGDDAGVLAEVQRLRTLYGAPKVGSYYELDVTFRTKGAAAARALFEASDVSDRSVYTAKMVAPAGLEGETWLRKQLRPIDGDPGSIGDLRTARKLAGDAAFSRDVASEYEARTKALIDADRKQPARANVGTLILGREEKYEVEADGFLHGVAWDLRRLDGTTDVESNASARYGYTSGGHGGLWKTVHRIYKKDGRVVEPDRIAAAQAGAELSQIEVGDYVEMVAEGWIGPRADGKLDLDTPDLLPARTAVEHATIELAYPSSLPLDVWTHAELGKAEASDAGGRKRLTWTLKDHGVRRSEKGQPSLDASVCLRMGSWGWDHLARNARESMLSDVDHDPEVTAWVNGAVGADRAPSVDLLARLSKAAKRAIPRVGFLPLGGGYVGGYQWFTARTALLDAQGSRVSLVHRALDELGIPNEVVWAETTPYSADPKMVARSWRFSKALLVAQVPDKPGGEAKSVWLDLDVEGMPPPPNRTSPELRGRMAMGTSGKIVPVPPNAADDPDVATIELTVDETGKAKGTFALLLRGRDAQEIAWTLEESAGDNRDEALRAQVASWIPEADVLEVKASAETWQVVLNAKIEIPNFLVPDGSRLAMAGAAPLHWGRAATLGATYAAQAKRTTALRISAATIYTVHRVVHLPKGTAIATPLPSLDVTDPTTKLRATRSVKIDGSTVLDDVTFTMPTAVVQPSEFDSFTANARLIDDGFLSVVRVQPAPGAIKLPVASTTGKDAKPPAPATTTTPKAPVAPPVAPKPTPAPTTKPK